MVTILAAKPRTARLFCGADFTPEARWGGRTQSGKPNQNTEDTMESALMGKIVGLDTIKRFALPIGLAILTVIGVHQYLDQKAQALDEQTRQQMVTRIVAATDLPIGKQLSFDDLSLRQMPQAWVGPETFDAEQADALEHMVVIEPLIAGQPITRQAIAPPKPPALSEKLAPGRRAVTIPVNQVSSLSGRLETDDVIDIYVTFNHQGQRVTTLLVNAVRVLTTDRPLLPQGFDRSEAGVTTVTLDVSAPEAVKLVSAHQDGVLTAVLRLDAEPQQSTVVAPSKAANHLAGFVGLAPSLGEGQAPTILYGDTGGFEQTLP
jgi:pilus assembly protein CpaB